MSGGCGADGAECGNVFGNCGVCADHGGGKVSDGYGCDFDHDKAV